MDNLTHSLVGALIGQAGLKRRTGLAMPALIIGANLPDIDASCVLLGGMRHLALRRGVTHGPIAWVVLPLVLAGALWWYDRWQDKRGRRPEARLPVRFGWLWGLAFIACITHPALDWLNSYGIRLLAPFSERWYYGDTLFIVDVWLWAGLGFATWLSLRREKRGGDWKRIGRVALSCAAIYISLNWIITVHFRGVIRHRDAHTVDAIANPVPLNPFARDLIAVNGYPWPKSVWKNGSEVGDFAISDCAMDRLRKAGPDVEAFLFWSRAPFIEKRDGGGLWLRDARFLGFGNRLSVRIPDDVCRTGSSRKG